MKEVIQRKARELGFDDCKVTSASRPDSASRFESWIESGRHGTMAYLERNAFKRVNPDEVLRGAKSIITLAVSYYSEEKQDHSRGVVARYAQYEDYHDVLAERLKLLSAFINELGGSEEKNLWYVDTGPLLERDLAQRAGLGFVGKHTNLISRKSGNWFFISEIITTLEIEPDLPEKNRCGNCTSCLDACPTAAITAPFQLDARRCISYLTIELKGSIPEELRPLIGNRIYGCDACLEVCPWNRFAHSGKIMLQHQRADLNGPDLLELLRLDQDGFKKRFKNSPLLRTKRRGVLRNVCVALGNVGDENALTELDRARNDPEPLIAEHATWAIKRIQERTREETKAISLGQEP